MIANNQSMIHNVMRSMLMDKQTPIEWHYKKVIADLEQQKTVVAADYGATLFQLDAAIAILRSHINKNRPKRGRPPKARPESLNMLRGIGMGGKKYFISVKSEGESK